MSLLVMDRLERVLMVGTDPDSRGGISSVIRLYAEAGLLGRLRFLASYTDGSLLKKLAFYGKFWLRYEWTLFSCPSIEIVHVHSASYGSFARKSLVILLAKLWGKRTITHIHGAEFAVFYDKSPAWKKWFIRSVLRSSDALVALSRQWKLELERISGNPNVWVLYNPTQMHPPVYEQENQSDASAAMPVNFLFMGRLGKRKGVYDIIESARHLKAENVRIQLYGDGELAEVQRRVRERGVQDKISVCGWIDGGRKDEVFRQANVLILPSYNEGLPISVLEAMSYGLPVVATDVGGISEAVEDGVSGYLMQPGDCAKLGQSIEYLATSADLRRQMGQSGYALASRKFSLAVIVQKLEALYDQLAAQ